MKNQSSILHNNMLVDAVKRFKGRSGRIDRTFRLDGHLKIIEFVRGETPEVVFDQHNLIVDEGLGHVMDFLAKNAFSYDMPSPFSAIVLTSNTSPETASDTFLNSVFDPGGTDYISDEGVLSIPTWTVVTHTEGSLLIQLSGTITNAYGNDPANNHINSVCVCAGLTAGVGGPGESAYTQSGDERLFSRVNVGDLVKEATKSYNFEWQFSIL